MERKAILVSVGRPSGLCVVGVVAGQLLLVGAIGVGHVYLGVAAVVDPCDLAVDRPVRVAVASRHVADVHQAGSIGIDGIDFVVVARLAVVGQPVDRRRVQVEVGNDRQVGARPTGQDLDVIGIGAGGLAVVSGYDRVVVGLAADAVGQDLVGELERPARDHGERAGPGQRSGRRPPGCPHPSGLIPSARS